MHLQFEKELVEKQTKIKEVKKGESDAQRKRSHALVSAQNHFQMIQLSHGVLILTDIHG